MVIRAWNRGVDSPLCFLMASSKAILGDVPHELRLQLLRATLAADVQGPLAAGEFLVPWRQMYDWNLWLLE